MSVAPPLLLLLPFGAMIVSIAILPIALRHQWERSYHLVALFLAAIVVIYYAVFLRETAGLIHQAHDYISFMSLAAALFVVTGGIHFNLTGSTGLLTRLLFLAGGGLLANVIGTTGASVLLIRPWMQLNRDAYRPRHTAFFIFIVSNVGGGLTPIGDPPLLLGFIKGVPFWWVAQNCWAPWLFTFLSLLAIFYLMERIWPAPGHKKGGATNFSVHLYGKRNLVFLAVILVAVFISNPPFVREILMLLAAIGSYLATPHAVHRANSFTFAPLREVAWLFFGIFGTILPVIEYLQVNAGSLPLHSASHYFWIAGALSSVLDNAPTYLTLLSAAFARAGLNLDSQVAEFLLHHGRTLAAISIASVFCGAVTYIGNGPNLLVKATLEQCGRPVPGFFSYIFVFALPVFIPILLLVWLFFV